MAESGILERSLLTQDLLLHLRTDIICRRIGHGEAMRELKLAESYNVSRAVVRAAMLVLEKDGLISVMPNGTKYACCPEPRDINNLYSLRLYIEQTAVRQIFEQDGIREPLIFDIAKEIDRSQGSSVYELLDIDSEFHRAVIQCSGNKALLQVWDTISGVIKAIFYLNMTESEEYREWFRETFRERHIHLFTSLMSGNEKTCVLFSSHIEDAREISRKAVEKICGNKE